MKIGKFKVDNHTLFIIILCIVFIIVLIFNPNFIAVVKKPFTTVQILPINEPITSEECRNIKGILVNPDQNCPAYYINWGYGFTNGERLACCVPDLCTTTKGKYVTTFNEANKRFERKCVCNVPALYNIKTGCTIPYQ